MILGASDAKELNWKNSRSIVGRCKIWSDMDALFYESGFRPFKGVIAFTSLFSCLLLRSQAFIELRLAGIYIWIQLL